MKEDLLLLFKSFLNDVYDDEDNFFNNIFDINENEIKENIESKDDECYNNNEEELIKKLNGLIYIKNSNKKKKF